MHADIELRASRFPRVSVIVPATGSRDLLRAALRSVASNGPSDIEFEVIVVLNESDEADVHDLNATVTGVQFLQSSVNLGLAGAANRGRAAASGELLIVLHDDAEVEPGWIEALVEAADSHPGAGVIGGKVLSLDGRLQNAGMVLWRDANSSAPWTDLAPPPTAFDEVRQVDYCGTSSLLIRAELWDAIGGLDERFYPVYYVDVDLAMTARSLGWVVLYQPKSRIRHHSGASGTSRWRTFVYDRNRHLFIAKWGDALQHHEPAGDTFAVRRAIDRAARWHPNPTEWRDPTRPHGSRVSAAPPHSDMYYLQKDLVLTKAYVMSLTHILDDVEHELGIAHSDLAHANRELAALRAMSVYLPGTRLTLCEHGSAHRYQLSGGHAPESWGLWIGNDPITIALPLPTDEAHRAPEGWTVRIEAVSFLNAQRTTSPFTVTINGDVIIAVNETKPDLRTYEEHFRARDDWTDRQFVVRIHGTDPTSPGTDSRMLSLGLVSLTIETGDTTRL